MAEEQKYGGISSDAVKDKTGRGWAEWIRTLDKEKAHALPHKEIAKLVHGKYAIPGWWSQMVTVGYEQAKGLREAHQKADGFAASVSRTVPMAASEVYASLMDAKARKKWAGAAKFEVTKSTENKTLRLRFEDGTRASIELYAKGVSKTQIAVQHEKLGNKAAVTERKAYWSNALDSVIALNAGKSPKPR